MKRIKYKVTLPHPIINFNVKKHFVVRDGPLENLLGGGGGGEVQKNSPPPPPPPITFLMVRPLNALFL